MAMEYIPVMRGGLSLPWYVAGKDAHNLIVIEGLADEGGDHARLESSLNGQVVLVKVAGNNDDGQMDICFAQLPGQFETIAVRQFGV